MAKKKTDDQLRTEITLHSEAARDLLGKSHEIHMQALQTESTTEHTQTMGRVFELQRLAIKETKEVSRLEKVLQNRQRKMMANQLADINQRFL